MASNSIYIPIEDVTRTKGKAGSPSVVDIREGAQAYKRGDDGFVKAGKIKRKKSSSSSRRKREAAEEAARKEQNRILQEKLEQEQQRQREIKQAKEQAIQDKAYRERRIQPTTITVPSTFVGPLQPGVTRKAPIKLSKYRLTPSDVSGTGKLTKAIDVGGGMMQDQIITYSGGRIISVEPTGPAIPQSKRFKDLTKSLLKDSTDDVIYSSGYGYSVSPELQTKFIKGLPKPTDKSFIIRAEDWLKSKRIPKEEQPFYSPEKIKGAYGWAATQTIKGGKFLGTKTQQVADYFGADKKSKAYKFLFDPSKSPIKGETAKGIISSAYMFTSLSPFIKTGAEQIQESQYVYDVKKGKFVKKADLKEWLTRDKIIKDGKAIKIKKLTYSDKASKINQLLSRAKTPEARAEILKIAKETYGKEFIKDFTAQELGAIFKPTGIKPSIYAGQGTYEQSASTAYTEAFRETFTNLPQMPRIDVILTGVKTVQDTFKPTVEVAASVLTSSNILDLSKTGIDVVQVPDTTQFQPTSTKQSPKQKSGQRTIQIPSIPIPTVPIIPTTTYFGTPTALSQRAPKSPKIPLLLPNLFPTTPPKQRKKPNGYIPQVKSKGKWKTVGKVMDRNSALSRASRGADLTTARSIRIKPTNRRPQVTGVAGWGMRKYKFKAGKKPNHYIERSRFAIDTPTEIRGLTIGKLSSQMNWGPTTNKKKKVVKGKLTKKKKKTKSPWLF